MPKNNNQVEPYSITKAAIIIVALALFDTIGCIVLLVGSIIFMKKGHQGLSIALAITNIVIPDAMPCVDEIFQIIVVVVPIWQSYKNGDSLGQTVNNVIDSQREYQTQKADALNKSEKVVQVINSMNGNNNYHSSESNQEYIDTNYDN